MTLPASGLITMSMINVELGRAATAALNLNDPDARALAGVPSGIISMSNFYGKSAQFSTDFSEYAVGAQPSDWTKRWATTWTAIVQTTSGSLSGKALRWTKTTNDRGMLSWNKIPFAANVEILMRCRTVGSFTNETMIRSMARGSGAVGAENAYGCGLNTNTTTGTRYFVQLTKYVAGAGSNIGPAVFGPGPTFNNGDWTWMRFNLTGTTLNGKLWKDGTAEPGAYQATVADVDVTAGGWVGLLNSPNGPNMDIDFFSVGIAGRPAPGP